MAEQTLADAVEQCKRCVSKVSSAVGADNARPEDNRRPTFAVSSHTTPLYYSIIYTTYRSHNVYLLFLNKLKIENLLEIMVVNQSSKLKKKMLILFTEHFKGILMIVQWSYYLCSQ